MPKRAVEDEILDRADRAEIEYCAEGYENLRIAIVQQAAAELAQAVRALNRYRNADSEKARERYYEAKKLREDCESFFRSAWFEFLTGGAINGEDVIAEAVKTAMHPRGRAAGGIASSKRVRSRN